MPIRENTACNTLRTVVKLPDNQQERLRLISEESSETTCRMSQVNEELAVLLGILFTDGCVSHKGKKSWRLYFVNKSRILIDLYKKSIISRFDLQPARVREHLTKDGLIAVVVDSKEIGNYLVETFGTFRTLKYDDGTFPATRLPICQLISSNLVALFLRVAFSCDGGLRFYKARRKGNRGGTSWLIRTVFISCVHKELRNDYCKLLASLGIESNNSFKDGKVKIETEKNIRKFQEIVGFVPGVLVTRNSRYWEGVEKNEVLRLMIKSYENPKAILNLPKFK